jgi:arginine utilization regulatory protein
VFIEEFISFISADSPLHIICDAKMKPVNISDKLSNLLNFNHSDKIQLIKQLECFTPNSNTITNINRKKYTLSRMSFTNEGEMLYLIKLKEFNINNNIEIKLHCLEEIIKNINDGIIVSDLEGRIIMYNSAQEKLEGLSSLEIVGKYLWEAYNYKSIELSEHRKVFSTGKPIINKYSAHSHKNGIDKYLSYSTYPIYKDNEIVAVYSISKNETTLMNLLSETIELKRCIRGPHKNKEIITNGTRFTFSDIIGESVSTKNTITEAQNIALIDSNLLIVGETGTGKEVFAHSIHNLGKNRNQPFVAINCGAIPDNLLESTLFGTVKGSFTGAQNQTGLFEQAQNGTMFLDELNSLPISMQSKLLRVVQERKVRPIGSNDTVSINCRIITAINEDPYKIIESGKLREDLFYRISSVYLQISPLRDRLNDLPSLTDYFINKYNQIFNKNIQSISSDLNDILYNYSWPGNVRELEHIIENLMIRANQEDRKLLIEHMPAYTKSLLLSKQNADAKNYLTCNLTGTLKIIEERLIRECQVKTNSELVKREKMTSI